MNEQQALGKFYTPDNLALAMVRAVIPEFLSVGVALEPSVGGGAFVHAIREYWPNCHIIGVDIDPEAPGLALCDETFIGDFLDYAKDAERRHDLVIGNPPFSVGEWRDCGKKKPNVKGEKRLNPETGNWERLVKTEVAESHVRASIGLLNRNGLASFLVPAGFLHASGRSDLLKSLRIERKITPRPPFAPDGGTDNRDYSCFSWRSDNMCARFAPERLSWEKPSRKK